MKSRNNVRNERIIGAIEFFKNKPAQEVLDIILAKTGHCKDERIMDEPYTENEKNTIVIRKTL